ncbi:MAG: VOC family protein [Gemmatimonadaceae bacterium]
MSIHELYAYLHVKNAAKAIEFYTKAFGAKEKFRLSDPNGRVGHAELDFGGHTLMLSDEFPEYGVHGSEAGAKTHVTIHLHVDNADEMVQRAVTAGAKIEVELRDYSHGERSGAIRDPFGHRWLIGHNIEEVSPAEMQRRYTENP